MSTSAKAKKKAQPAAWGDADYAAKGFGRLTLRAPQRDIDAIAELAERLGVSRAEAIAAAVRDALKR